MLLSLRIENFALVDRLELGLGKGLTVMTGETGAGKSIILDAIDAVLGGKVTSRAVRTGADRALIEAVFRLEPDLATWLEQQEIALTAETELVCTREIVASQSSQRSRSRINGALVNKQQMEYLRDRLVELTAQGQTVQIGQPPLQREWLDSYGGEPLLKQRSTVVAAFSAYQQALQALEKRRKSEQERLQQLDLFEYQLKELSAANLTEADELDQLEQERKRLSHSVELQHQSYQVYQALYQNDEGAEACADLLGKAESTLQDMAEYDVQIQPILELVSNALAQVEQAGREINVYGETLEADPQRLQEVQERIVELKQLCRKYGPTLGDAIALLQRLQADMDELTGGGQSLEDLEHTYQERQLALTDACALLTQRRQATAKELEERLVSELKPLAMEKVKFQVDISPATPSALGGDRVTFLFSPNPGEPLQPLTEIASGGEMSRFLLALQSSFSQIDPVGTLVFDEIDVGVSGRVTQAIAEKLHQLSQHHQVLCVTHQPIVAAMADQHLRVSKQVIEEENGKFVGNGKGLEEQGSKGAGEDIETKNAKRKTQNASTSHTPHPTPHTLDSVRTVVRVTTLDSQQRREELAQLAGGQSTAETSEADDVAYAFADSLLKQAATLRETRSGEPKLAAEPQPAAEPKPAEPKPKATRAKASRKG
ncbi:DNA repair protein RecN [Stenomitos frigidus]|uniref:DNA repair protein RecN n=1 Tax=Stenomitos frigidus ULC18 TaxID=2107698 RepID=A0A2T1DT38_9CYAN|nr:DNA repair protein RecN [Stenomitos frigidus]PSB23640.1 DNA repair protein RecN [Stenomitos frigidus ULC18]